MEFEDIYKQYFKDVYYFILAISKNPDTAEEITQETFYKALKNLRRFKGDCTVKTWLCQIGKNTYLSHLKKQTQTIGDDPTQAVCSEDAESLYISREESLSIYKILHLLEEPYKEVFTLRVLGDLSFREIGEIFGRNEGWARVTFHRSRLKLQDSIRKEDL